MKRFYVLGLMALVCLAGCNNSKQASNSGGSGGAEESFSLAWSEYPSWSVFGVADAVGLIDKAEGKRGKMEEKWGVDIVLKQLSYDACLEAYGNSSIDAVCITNMDILAPSTGRNSVAIMPTSTSAGADACIAVGIDSVDELKGKDSYGLQLSVSQYMFERALEEMGKDPKDFPFKQKDPELAARAMRTGEESIESIVVWNPFVMQTLRDLPGKAKVMFDSTQIPEEIIDMVVVGEETLKREGGDKFAACIADTFYEISSMIENPETRADTLKKLGLNFSGLSAEDMEVIVAQTKFYKTSEEGAGLFERSDFQNTIMPKVIEFCATHDIAEKPSVVYGEGAGQLRFDTSYMKQVSAEPAAAQ